MRLYTRPWKIVSFSPEKFQRIQFCVQVAVTTPKRENSRGEVVPETKDKITRYKVTSNGCQSYTTNPISMTYRKIFT